MLNSHDISITISEYLTKKQNFILFLGELRLDDFRKSEIIALDDVNPSFSSRSVLQELPKLRSDVKIFTENLGAKRSMNRLKGIDVTGARKKP